MVLESTQLLNNALIKHAPDYKPIYKLTHINHPATKWCSETIANFNWLQELALELCHEYTYRYGKIHKCQAIIEYISKSHHKDQIPKGTLTPFAQCMPDIYKSDNAIISYRKYYKYEKNKIAVWSKRSVPDWWHKIND
jgi:hypothetical protein